MHKKVLFSILLVLTARPALALDETVGCNILDPEFDETNKFMVFQWIKLFANGTTTNYGKAQWVMANGDLVPIGALGSSNDGVIANADVRNYGESQAGPKFSNGVTGGDPELYVAYSRFDQNVGSVGLIKYDSNAIGCSPGVNSPKPCFQGANSFKTIPADPTSTPNDYRVITYTTEDEMNPFPAAAIYHLFKPNSPPQHFIQWSDINGWFNNNGTEPSSRNIAAVQGQWGRLQLYHTVDGSLQLWAATVANGAISLVKADDSTVVQPVVGGLLEKFNPWLFYHLGSQKNMLVYRETTESGLLSNIVIYVEKTRGVGDWQFHRRIYAADLFSDDGTGAVTSENDQGRRHLLSPETFDYTGSTYVLFSSSDLRNVGMSMDGNIWVVKVDSNPTAPLAYIRANSRPTNVGGEDMSARSRVEGEVYFGSNQGPTIYYSQVTQLDDPDTLPDGCPLVNGTFVRNYSLRKATVTLP